MQKNRHLFTLDPLDSRLVLAKPKHSIKESAVKALEEKGNLVITRKRDGYRMLMSISKGQVRCYTRGMCETTAHVPRIAEAIKKLDLPSDGVLLDGELLVSRDDADDIALLTSIVKSDRETAHQLQKQHPVSYIILNIIMLDHQLLIDRPFNERLNFVQMLFTGNKHFPLPLIHNAPVLPIEQLWCDFEASKQRVHREKWEGLVLYDRTKPTEIRLDGNIASPPRPNGCWKWKPLKEDDFIVRRWVYGTKGKAHERRMGKLFLSQIDPRTGKEVSCGEVGGGFTVAMREFFAHEAKYPLVIQVEFDKKFPSNALRNPRFRRTRHDKTPEECVLEREDTEN